MRLWKGAIAVAAVALAVTAVAWAGEATQEYEWSADLDCSICHQKEWESLYGSSDESKDAANEQDASKADEKDAAADAKVDAKTDAKTDTKSEAKADAQDKDADQKQESADEEKEAAIEAYTAMHAQTLMLTCISCHPDSDKLAEAHKSLNSGKEAKRLKKTSVSSEICLACHNMEDLAKATADKELLKDRNGNVVNPHALPTNDDHSGIMCSNCHKAHQTNGKSVAETAYTTCVGCHHEEVFECGTCHS
ncbi:MAG: hypothetical protein IKE43_04640 [Coriobacteriales bacterium]|nr:hypothetical protein [Coriobacteriales bacterium]